MENNLVELKYDRVNEYFEKFKQKYTNNYEENKTKGYRTVIPLSYVNLAHYYECN